MSVIQFRKASLADLPLVQEIGRATYEPYYQHIWYPGGVEFYLEHCFGTETLGNELQNPHLSYYLPSDSAGNIMALVKVHPHSPVPDGSADNALYLEKIYLMPDFFGQGTGQVLLAQIEQMAIEMGREAIWLQVMHNPGPIGAYAKAGYRITGPTRFEFDLLKEEERDGWVMVKQV